jgi:hypothetical protein
MNIMEFTALLWFGSQVAGFLGPLTGLRQSRSFSTRDVAKLVERRCPDKRIEDIVGHSLYAACCFQHSSSCVVQQFISRDMTVRPPIYPVFQGEPSNLRSLAGIVRDAIDLDGRGLIPLGLLLLIATPVARSAFSVFGFAGERDPICMSFSRSWCSRF